MPDSGRRDRVRRAAPDARDRLGAFGDLALYEQIPPVVAAARVASIVETGSRVGTAGEAETRGDGDGRRARTERPVETESEIMKLLRRAKELGVAPHVLDIGCRRIQGAGGRAKPGVQAGQSTTTSC
jgi:hypothetical protein